MPNTPERSPSTAQRITQRGGQRVRRHGHHHLLRKVLTAMNYSDKTNRPSETRTAWKQDRLSLPVLALELERVLERLLRPRRISCGQGNPSDSPIVSGRMRADEPHRSGGGEDVSPLIHHVDPHKTITYRITHRQRPRTRFYLTTAMTSLTDGARNSFPPAMASSYGVPFCPGNWSGPEARRCRCTDALRQRE